MRRMILLIAAICLMEMAGDAQTPASAVAPTPLTDASSLTELKRKFEGDMRDFQKQQRDELKVLQRIYTEGLTKLEGQLQEKGEMQAVIAVRDEKTRFDQAGEIPAGALVGDPVVLRKAQDDWNAQAQQVILTYAKKIVALSERYMQQLALLQKTLAGRSDQEGLAAVKDETERLLGNNVIREALVQVKAAKPGTPEKPAATTAATPPTPAKPETPATPAKPPEAKMVEVGDYKFYPTGKEPSVKDSRDQRLEFPSTERRNATYWYALGAKIYFDKANMTTDRHTVYDYATKTERGDLSTYPRITMACRNKDIPEGSKLVIQYFSRLVARTSDIREERVELITLPQIVRGQSLSVDGQGIVLYKEESRSTYGYHSRSGREYGGLIISIFDPDGKLLIQQCTTSSLFKECAATLPAAKEQESPGPRRNPPRQPPPQGAP